MATQNDNKGPALSNVPEIKTFQIDNEAIGQVKNSVNMFRGEVNLPVNLVSLSGRNGLDVNVMALYEGNVHRYVDTWNLEAPTGVVGLGWMLQAEQIIVDYKNTGTRHDDEYYLVSGGSANPLICTRIDSSTGILYFQTRSYQFWQIQYNPNSEIWTITKEDGLKYTYGDKNSNRQTVQWGVKWNNWIGSTVVSGTGQFVQAWNLSQIASPWGDFVTYEYCNVQQNVGSGPYQYTKASYLKKITDVFGRTVNFNYEPKLYSQSGPGGQLVFEYQDPHSVNMINASACTDTTWKDGAPDAYQDRYETLYLDNIAVNAQQGDLLFSIKLGYDLINVSGYATSSALYPYLWKRVLTSITQLNAAAQPLPGMQFAYYGQSDVYPGALKTVTYPEGGSATYTYAQTQVVNANRKLAINSPAAGSTPRVWWGPNYVVVTWYNATAGTLQLNVYSWIGTWYTQQPGFTVNVPANQINSLQIAPGDGYFILHFQNTAPAGEQVIIYQRDLNQFGNWKQAYSGVLGLSSNSAPTIFTAGNRFAVFYNPNFTGAKFQGITWDWRSRQWTTSLRLPTVTTSSSTQVALAAYNNYYVVFAYTAASQSGNFQLFYRDETSMWQAGSSFNLSSLTIYQPPNGQFLFQWSVSETFAVATYVTAASQSPATYQLRIFQWDENYFIQNPSGFMPPASTQPFSGGQLNFPATFLQNSLIGNGQNLLRYAGGSTSNWKQTSFAPLSTTSTNQFAYGNDVAMMSSASGGAYKNQYVAFNPNSTNNTINNNAGWGTPQVPQSLPSNAQSPTAGYNFFTFGNTVYAYQPSGNWTAQLPVMPDTINYSSILNRAPRYIIYQNQAGNTSYVILLKNGGVQTPISLASEQIYTGKEMTTPGAMLAGPTSYVTYPSGQSFDSASTLYLYQIMKGAVYGPVYTYQVASIEINDGYSADEPYYQSYVYDQTAVVLDPAAGVAQYALVTVVPGSPNSQNKPHGYTKNYYSNGTSQSGAALYPVGWIYNYYMILNGVLLGTQDYDANGRLVSSTVDYWQTYTVAGGSNQLAGAFVRPIKRVKMQDGVSNTSEYSFDASTGMLTQATTYNYDSQGRKQTRTKNHMYAWQVQAYQQGILQENLLSSVVQTTEQVLTAGQTSPQIISVVATTWKDWGSGQWGPQKNYQWKGPVGTTAPSFDFQNWSGNNEPPPSAGWLKTSEVTSRTSLGLPQETMGVEGEYGALQLYQATLYDTSSNFAVAQFNVTRPATALPPLPALASEATYYGFESYESNQGWQINPGNQPISQYLYSGDSHTGEWCLRLPGNSQQVGPQLTLQPSYQNQSFVLSSWVKTSSGFASSAGTACWQVSFFANNQPVGSPIVVPIPDTNGQWQYLYKVIDVAAFRAQNSVPSNTLLTIQLFAYNQKQSSTYLLIDDVRFSQVEGNFTANVYDPVEWVVTASLGSNGETMRKVYDSYRRNIAAVGPNENVTTLSFNYYSRQGNGNVFAPNDPNSSLQIKARSGGFYDDFRDGQWQDIWQSNNPSAYVVQNQTLVHNAASQPAGQPDTLTLRNSGGYVNYGVRVEVTPGQTLSQTLGINVGNKATVQWTPQGSGGTWQLLDSSNNPVQSVAGAVAKEWLLLAVNNSILFYADGKQLFAQTLQGGVYGSLQIFTGAQNQVAYQGIIVFNDPLLSMAYKTGTGQENQKQALDGVNCIVSETLYDDLGRPAVSTMATRIANALIGFQQGFITGFDWTTGVMQGQAANLNPQAGGYPYSRQLYDNSPAGRIIEKGLPGADFAINLTVAPSARHTTKFQYTTNAAGGFMGSLPPGQYFQRTTTDPDNVQSITLADQLGNQIATGTLISSAGPAQYVMSSIDYDAANNAVASKPPNYYSPPAGSSANSWITTMAYDIFKRLTQRTTPDSGQIQYIYDDAGRQRFIMDANGAAQSPNTILYQEYDILGRVVQKGSISQNWNASQLQTDASTQPAWPPTPATWQKQYAYDGDGTQPFMLGRLEQVSVNNGPGTQPVVETFGYDISGNVVTKGISVGDYDNGNAYTCLYQYNNLNAITQITYPSAGSGAPMQVVYTYNDLGLIASLGSASSAPDSYASYAYNANGGIQSQQYNNSATPLSRSVAYNPPNWPTSLSDNFLGETLNYTSGGYQGAAYYNGNVAQKIDTANWNSGSSPCGIELQYDNLGQIKVADYSNSGCAFAQVEQYSYDASGNFSSVIEGGAARGYTYYAGTNKVQNSSGTTSNDYVYDANGNLTQSLPKNITNIAYDAYTQLPTRVSVGGATPLTVAFEYGGKDQRVLKVSTPASGASPSYKFYVHGMNDYPLMEKSKDADGTAHVTFYVYGPGGLIAFQRDGALYFVLKDYIGSVRVVFDSANNLVSAYDYKVFGATMGTPHGNAGIISYLYTGQEFDAETQLYNYRARFYDPSLMRFYAPDPASQFASPYIYAANNPLRYVDPTGGFIQLIAVLIGAIIGAIAGAISGVISIVSGHLSGGKAAGVFFANFFAGMVAGALAPLAPAATAAIIEGTAAAESAVIATSLVIGAAVVGDAALGAAQGAIGNAVVDEDAGQGAWIGALTGGVNGFIGTGAGEIGGRLLQRAGSRAISEIAEDASSDEIRAIQRATVRKAVAINVVGGIVGGAAGGTIQAKLAGENTEDIIINMFAGGFLAAASGGFSFYHTSTRDFVLGIRRGVQTQGTELQMLKSSNASNYNTFD